MSGPKRDFVYVGELPDHLVTAARILEDWHAEHGMSHWALFGICSRNMEFDRIKLREIARAWRLEAAQYMRQVEEARQKKIDHQGMLARAVSLNGCAQAVEKVLG